MVSYHHRTQFLNRLKQSFQKLVKIIKAREEQSEILPLVPIKNLPSRPAQILASNIKEVLLISRGDYCWVIRF